MGRRRSTGVQEGRKGLRLSRDLSKGPNRGGEGEGGGGLPCEPESELQRLQEGARKEERVPLK